MSLITNEVIRKYAKELAKEVGLGFTASQNDKIGKIVDNFYIQLNTS